MDIKFNNLKLSGIAVAVPTQETSVEAFSDIFGLQEIKRIAISTGIETLRIATRDQKTSDFCLAAARKLLQSLSLEAEDLDAIIFISQTPDYRMPATSCLLQDRLGMKKNSLAFDINYGCSAYIYGLFQAALLLHAGACKKVLLCVGDTITKHLDPSDQKSRLVFGDGGSATLIEQGKDSMAFNIMTDGAGGDRLIIDKKADGTDDHLFMDGSAIMEFVLREVPSSIDNVLTQMNWNKEDIGLVAAHQANKFIVDYLRKKLRLEKDKVPVAVQGYGNTGPASIPLLLAHYRDQLSLEAKKKTVLSGFGVGLSWGSVALDISNTCIAEIVEI